MPHPGQRRSWAPAEYRESPWPQACTTGTTCLFQAAVGVETGLYKNVYVMTTDRTSNGPHTIWPNPKGPGGEVISENWLMDNFNSDPNVGHAHGRNR
jgi:acetyl-CoA acetyltransferase